MVLQEDHQKMDEFMKTGEVAKFLRICPRTVRTYIKGGHLKAIMLPGGDYRLRKDDIKRLVESNLQGKKET